MHGRGAFVVGGVWQGVCAWQGACMAGGHAWKGMCMAGGHSWQGTCMEGGMCGRGVHDRYYDIWSMSGWYTSYWNAFLFME